MAYSVILAIPDIEADSPEKAVAAFVAAVDGDPWQWLYLVEDETGRKTAVEGEAGQLASIGQEKLL